MHIPLLRTFTLGLLIAVLAACSSVDAPAEEVEVASLSETQTDTDAPAPDGALETLQATKFSGEEEDRRGSGLQPFPRNGVCFYRGRNVQSERLCFTSSEPVPVGFTSNWRSIRPSWNDDVSSLIVAPGYDVVMYTDANFGGRATVAGLPDEPRYVYRVNANDDDTLSSFKIIRKN